MNNPELLRQWRAEHDRCQLCGRPLEGTSGPHHIILAGRWDVEWNLLQLCEGETPEWFLGCHPAFHQGNKVRRTLTLGQVIMTKALFDPEHWSPRDLVKRWRNEHASVVALPMESLPGWVWVERTRHGIEP